MSRTTRRAMLTLALATPALLTVTRRSQAQKASAPGVTDSEITIGQTMPYSGPASSYGTIGRAEANYIRMINDQGGMNGRRINLISLDDSYSPPRTVELTRRLIEQDKVAFLFNPLGTPTTNGTRKYVNERKVPQVFIASGATQFGDREHYPWSMGWQPTYQIEGAIYARHVLTTAPDLKIAMIYQNDDSGKDFLKGFRDGLNRLSGDKTMAERMMIAVNSYEPTDPTIDSQIVSLRESGADALYVSAIPKMAAMAIRKTHDMGWRPKLFLLSSVGSSVATGINPAGPENAVGIITAHFLKDPTDPQWASDPGFKDWLAWMRKYYPDGDLNDSGNVYGYSVTQTLVQVLKQCGDDLSRENIMRQATNLDMSLPLLHAGIRVKTAPDDYYPIKQMRLVRFDGKAWVPFGEAVAAG